MSEPPEHEAPAASRRLWRLWRSTDTDWLGRRSPGEVLALLALILSAFALVVVLDGADMPGSLRGQLGAVVQYVEQRVAPVTALALVPAVVLAGVLVVVARGWAHSTRRANRLARELGDARRQIEQLKATLKARDEFLLAVVHELRTPLTHLVGYAELMSGELRPRRPDEIVEMQTAIQSASTTMLRLMDDLVEVTRLQTDGFTVRPRPVDIGRLVRDTVAGFEAGDDCHQLSIDVPNHWLTVLADPERLRQILVNLLTNAIIYSPNGGEIRVRARLHGRLVRIEVEDQGIGIDPEEHARVFERFYRASSGRAYRERGTGLGLSIVKELVEAHGGEVGLSSRPGVGSTFWFTVPSATETAVTLDARGAARRTAPAT